MVTPTVLTSLWERTRTSYWFVPTLLSMAAMAASVAMQRIDYAVGDALPTDAWWLYGGNADGARTVLGAVAGSMITVASVVFSITIVTLTLASGQFGSRLLRTFIRDRGNQIVLGVFIATFLYSLLVLRGVRGTGDTEFVPYLSVTLAVLLAIASVGVLIYFIHHVSMAIQADEVVASVAAEANASIQRLFPEHVGASSADAERPRPAPPLPAARLSRAVLARRDGYVEAIDAGRLMGLTEEHDLLVALLVKPGAFVAEGAPVARAWPADRVDEVVAQALSQTVALDVRRSLTQDAEFGLHQLVEVAVRALSPGINDPYTAESCLDRLGAALIRLAGRQFPSPDRYGDDGERRVVARGSSFGDFADVAFDAIRHHAASSPGVLTHMLDTIAAVAERARTDEQRRVLRDHARFTRDVGVREAKEERDRAAVEEHYRRVLVVVDSEPSPPRTIASAT